MAACGWASGSRRGPLSELALLLALSLTALALSAEGRGAALAGGQAGGEGARAEKWRLARRSYCVGSAGKCFSSGQCCDGLICAAFDDYFGQKPEVPGYCVKEKDLQVCAGSADCGAGSRCVTLGRTGERYCLPRAEIRNMLLEQQELEAGGALPPPLPVIAAAAKQQGGEAGKLNGLGSTCQTSADCKAVIEGGAASLCCQDVRRGRQGVRRICDRVTAISTCLD